MKLEGSIELFQYWNRLRGNKAAPRRTDIEPADIKTLLADTFILERDTRGEPVFRLAGTRICATHGRELKGFAFTSLWAERDRLAVDKLVRDVFQEKLVVVIGLEGFSRGGQSALFELLVLPLEGGNANPRALGTLLPYDKPYWLGSDPIAANRLDTMRVLDPDREPLFLKNRPALSVPPLAPDAGSLHDDDESGENGRRIRHLVVFEGGRTE